MSQNLKLQGRRGLWILSASVCMVAIAVYTLMRGENPVPKPRGYFRIALPEAEYRNYASECPMSFDVSTSAKVELFRDRLSADSCWFNIHYPKLNARIHCSYMRVDGNLENLIDDAYGFAAKHEMKATALRRSYLSDSTRHVYGIVYSIEGDAASNLQFFLTDSATHFMRGALYFFNAPNPDSLAPVLQYIGNDVARMTESLHWR